MADLPGILPPDAGRLERAARRYAIAVLSGCHDAAYALESLCGVCRVVTETMEQVRDFDPTGEVVYYTTPPRLLRSRVALYLRWAERVERGDVWGWWDGWSRHAAEMTGVPWSDLPTLDHAWRAVWESINGPESWAANPWVWVVNFKRVEVRHG